MGSSSFSSLCFWVFVLVFSASQRGVGVGDASSCVSFAWPTDGSDWLVVISGTLHYVNELVSRHGADLPQGGGFPGSSI